MNLVALCIMNYCNVKIKTAEDYFFIINQTGRDINVLLDHATKTKRTLIYKDQVFVLPKSIARTYVRDVFPFDRLVIAASIEKGEFKIW